MNKQALIILFVIALFGYLFPTGVIATEAASAAPTLMWIAPSEENGIPAQIDLFETDSSASDGQDRSYQLFLPGNALPEHCFLSWDGDITAVTGGISYRSGTCPAPAPGTEKIYSFMKGSQPLGSFHIKTYQGSSGVQSVFIDIDESRGTIAAMEGDPDQEISCTGRISINGQWYTMPKIKGRGNNSWSIAKDKFSYNVTLDSKITIAGIDSAATKKWSLLSEVSDHSLLRNRAGFQLAHRMGVGQDTISADVWINGEYRGCYTITPKNDSFITKNGFLIEEDNYKELTPVAEGGDPQFALEGMNGGLLFNNLITVKKIGDNLLKIDGEVDESPENIEKTVAGIRNWLQDAWDAIRADDGYNAKGKYYTEYIDVESFAKMYLLQEYIKSNDVCAGSIFFHRDGAGDNDKLFAGPLWDLDCALGLAENHQYLADPRSGKGLFITQISKTRGTSLYKTLGRHDDFMDEVRRQYSIYQPEFDAFAEDVDRLADEIEASARMNHIKVIDLSLGNFHRFGTTTVLEKGTAYEQTMLATTDSKNDWGNYVANLRSFTAARSLWFRNTDFHCPHEQTENIVIKAVPKADGCVRNECAACGKLLEKTVICAPNNYRLSAKAYTYNGTVRKPSVTVKDTAGTVVAPSNYSVTMTDSSGATVTSPKSAGAYQVRIEFHGERYSGSKTLSFTINKAPRKIKAVTPKSKSFSAAKKTGRLSKTHTITLKANVTPAKGSGKVTFRKMNKAGKSKITVSRSGKITIKKGLKKGTYKVRIEAAKAANTNFKKAVRTVTVSILVK